MDRKYPDQEMRVMAIEFGLHAVNPFGPVWRDCLLVIGQIGHSDIFLSCGLEKFTEMGSSVALRLEGPFHGNNEIAL